MSDLIIIALIGAGASLITTIITVVVSLQLGKYHRQNNSRLDELIASVKSEATLRGNKEGREELKDEQKEEKP